MSIIAINVEAEAILKDCSCEQLIRAAFDQYPICYVVEVVLEQLAKELEYCSEVDAGNVKDMIIELSREYLRGK